MKDYIIKHEVLGEINIQDYEDRKDYNINTELVFLGEKAQFNICFICYDNEEITEKQIATYNFFKDNHESILNEISKALFEYYAECYEEDGLEENGFNEIITEKELISLIGDEEDGTFVLYPSIYIEESIDFVIGFTINCAWNDHGIGMEIINGKVEEVGFQDIVL